MYAGRYVVAWNPINGKVQNANDLIFTILKGYPDYFKTFWDLGIFSSNNSIEVDAWINDLANKDTIQEALNNFPNEAFLIIIQILEPIVR